MRLIMAPPGLDADRGHVVEGLASASEGGVPPAVCLPSPDSDVHIERIDLEAESASAHALGGYDRSTGTHEGVEDDVAAPRAITQRVGDERHGFTVGCTERSSRRPARNALKPA